MPPRTVLSDASPLGVPFWVLANCGAEEARRCRNAEGKPGTDCPKAYLRANTEFTDKPICTSSRGYVKRKLDQLATGDLTPKQVETITEMVLSVDCVCHELSGGAAEVYDLPLSVNPLICPGPNIADFSREATLAEMVDHIYGRISIMTRTDRPHTFVREIAIYAEYLKKQISLFELELIDSTPLFFQEFKDNLLAGIGYYEDLAGKGIDGLGETFASDLARAAKEIDSIAIPA